MKFPTDTFIVATSGPLQSSYPVCLEDGVQAEEGHHSNQQPQQRRLERGLEV